MAKQHSIKRVSCSHRVVYCLTGGASEQKKGLTKNGCLEGGDQKPSGHQDAEGPGEQEAC
jgi:hypothetical protein